MPHRTSTQPLTFAIRLTCLASMISVVGVPALLTAQEDRQERGEVTDGDAGAIGGLPRIQHIASSDLLTCQEAIDQDDACFWIHPSDTDKSVAVVSDKSAGKVFVYDTMGNRLQTILAAKPGNIDSRVGIEIGSVARSIVTVNERDSQKLLVYQIDPTTRMLQRVDDGQIDTGENYGLALVRCPKTGELYCFTTSKESGVRQFRLGDNGRGQVSATPVRHWPLGMCEGAVGDDALGHIYVSVETEGIYRLPVDPADRSAPRRMVSVGQHGFVGDAEGLTILRGPGTQSYLLVSDQGASAFRVYRLADDQLDLAAVLAFEGVERTDGIDVTTAAWGEAFPMGAIICHSDREEGSTMRLIDLRKVYEVLRDAS